MNLSSFLLGMTIPILLYIALKLTAKRMKSNREEGRYNRPMPSQYQEKEIETQIENAFEKDEFDKKTREEKASHVDNRLDRFKKDKPE